MQNKKVLFVATVDMHINSFHLNQLKRLKEKGYEVHVATNSSEPIKGCDKKIQISISRSPFAFSNIRAIKALKKVIYAEKYDIVHCHTPMGSVVARLAAKKARKNGLKVFYTAHGFHFFEGAPKYYWVLFYPVEKYLAKYTDKLILINNEDYLLAKRKFLKRCKSIYYVPGVGVDEGRFEKKVTEATKNKLKKELGISKNDTVLLCVGRLDANKNQGFLIDVVKKLNEEKRNYKLILAGQDELNGLYQRKAKGAHGQIIFAGHRNDIPELLAISDVVVSASKREGLPVNIIEAAMSKLPIVMKKCRGAADIAKHYKNMKIVDGSLEDFVDAIKGAKKVDLKYDISFFSDKNIAKEMELIYEGE